MKMMNFRENLRFLMESKDMQIKELSSRTGISENTLKTYLKTDSAEPKISKAMQIAQALGVSVEFLATGKNSESDAHSYTIQEILSAAKQLSYRDQLIVLATIKAMKEHPILC